MKTSFTTLIIILILTNISYTQDCSEYDNLIQQGNTAFFKKNYERAVKRYNLAMLNCPKKALEVQEKILDVFVKIEQLKIDAEIALAEVEDQKKTIIEKSRTEKKILEEKIKAISAYLKSEEEKAKLNEVLKALQKEQEKNERIINSFYFYAGNFALAHNGEGYGFVDKEGNIAIEHKYDKALPFDDDIGLAYVEENYIRYLIDTSGTKYLTANHKKSMHSNTEAIDFRANSIKKINFSKKHYDLEVLLLDENRLTNIPPVIGKLEELKILSIADNNLTDIPLVIGKLEELKILSVADNNLTDIPPVIGKLEELKILNIADNNLNNIPVYIKNLKNLIVLDLSYNTSIKAIPNEIKNLEHLEEINFSGNRIRVVPESFQNLKKLKVLKIRDNDILYLPEFIKHFKQLEHLDLAGNELKRLPSEIGLLSKLKRLDLVSNELEYLPPEIGHLSNLEYLSLRHNNLKKLPDDIAYLRNIRNLDLSFNKISRQEKEKIKKLLPNCKITF